MADWQLSAMHQHKPIIMNCPKVQSVWTRWVWSHKIMCSTLLPDWSYGPRPGARSETMALYAGELHCKDVLHRGCLLPGMAKAEAQFDLEVEPVPESMPCPVLCRPSLTDPHVD